MITSSMNFRSTILYFIPGFIAMVNVSYWINYYNYPSLMRFIPINYSLIIFIVLSMLIGIFLEQFRLMIFLKIFDKIKILKIKRTTPSNLFFNEYELYVKLYDRIALNGILFYNLIIPTVISPWFLYVNNLYLKMICIIMINILLPIIFIAIGNWAENKFYFNMQSYMLCDIADKQVESELKQSRKRSIENKELKETVNRYEKLYGKLTKDD